MLRPAGALTITDGTRRIVIDPSTLTISTSTKQFNMGAVGNAHTLSVSGPATHPAAGRLLVYSGACIDQLQPLAVDA